jgi:tRNA (adenine22-N1)-methyltransferase
MYPRRLFTLTSLCPKDAALADIGSDHGLLPRQLWQQGFTHALYATELSASSVQQLKTNLADIPVQVYQADGLAGLPKAVKTVVIAGMGGRLITNLLSAQPNTLNEINTLILGPQRDQALVRWWLADHGWTITQEAFVYEHDQPYPFIIAKRGSMTLTPYTAEFGPLLIANPNPDFLAWMQHEITIGKAILLKHDNQPKRERLEWMAHYVKHHHPA